jgi:protein TonB
VVDPVVTRGIGGGCDEEALRAVRAAKFTPGKQRGKPVRVKMSLPITFRLR